MVYVFDELPALTDELYCSLLSSMPPDRVRKAERYRFIKDRKLCLAAYLLLVCGLESEYGLRGPFAFSYGTYGKPFLTDYPHVRFSLSHCDLGVACAISLTETGLDMQDVGRYDVKIAQTVCSDAELGALFRSRDRDVDFCRLWTRKESVLKLFGTGIAGDVKSVLREPGVQSFFYEGVSDDKPYIVCCSHFTGVRPSSVKRCALSCRGKMETLA